MSINKRLINTGVEAAPAAFDPLQNFETVTYTGNGGTQKITGYIRKGAAFNGSSSYIQTSLSPSLATISHSLWFYADSADSTNALYYFDNRGGRIDVNITGTGSNSVSNSLETVNITATTATSQWNHLLLVYTGWASSYSSGSYGSAITVTAYLNGSSIGTASPTPYGQTTGMRIGRSGGSYYFEGRVDQFRVFNSDVSSNISTLTGETYADATKSTTDIFNDGSGVALYELDEDANDTAGAGNNGKFGDAAFFNGSSSYIDIPTIPNITGLGSDFSFSAWINFDGTSGDRYIMSFRENSYIELGFNSGYSPRKLEFKVNDGSNKTVLVDESEITYNSWHHVCLTAESSGNLTAYLDGTVKGTTSIGSIGNAGQQNTIGAYHAGSVAGHFTGRIDDVRIYSDILTSQEVGYLYNNTTASIPTDYVAYYKLDGNATDETTNYDGTATNVSYGYDGTPTNVNFLGMSFTPDLVWIKNRDANSYPNIHDSVRGYDTDGSGGANSYIPLTTADPAGESGYTSSWHTSYGYLTSIDSNGFTVVDGSTAGDNYNDSGDNYVAWCWKAGGAAVLNEEGSIDSQVSANQAAGFSIVKYTGNQTASQTIGHGLSSAPELLIVKNIDASDNWAVYSSVTGNANKLLLNSTAASSSSGNWNSTTPTSTVFTISANSEVNQLNDDFIAYCFHSVDGYQKIGSYAGDDSTSGNVITTGFEPRWIMIKNITTGGGNWNIFDAVRDPSNTRDSYLAANTAAAEGSLNSVDFLSNGFEPRNGSEYINRSANNYIYLAIA